MFIDGIYYGSRSAHQDLKECSRLRLLGTDLDGTGYSLKAQRVPLIGGIHEHNVLADVLGHFSGITPLPLGEGHDAVDYAIATVKQAYIEDILKAGIRDLNDDEVRFTMQEQLTMLEGLTRGWVLYRMPMLLEEYDVVEIEQEWLFTLGPGVHWPIRMDAILRRKADGMLFIMDYKGTATGDEQWQAQHEYSDQTIIYMEALAERTGEQVGGMFYEGLVRGYWRTDTAKGSPFYQRKIQQTRLCYGYKYDDGTVVQRQSAHTAKKGWVKFRVADELSVQEWLDVLILEGVLPELFISMPPAAPPPALRAQIRNEILLREQRYLTDLRTYNDLRARLGDEHPEVQQHLALFAPRSTNRCNKYGADNRCPFKDGICLTASGGLDVLPEDESFEARTPHHDVESLVIRVKEVA